MKLSEFIALLNKLESHNIYYELKKVREEAIMIEVAVPGQHWEIEFLDDDSVDIEKFIADGELYNVEELETLFKDFTD